MAEKAARQGVVLRPHFKTHQSHLIGNWFRDHGVSSITVSSVDMAKYFAAQKWEDILIAFPVNIHQLPQMNVLARHVRLGLLVESEEVVKIMAGEITSPVDIWIKIDTGLGRTGIDSRQVELIARLIKTIEKYPILHFHGLLTHAGQTYKAAGKNQIVQTYLRSVREMLTLREQLNKQGISVERISSGDTPGCSLSENLGKVDEIRPGNFVFYDAQQFNLGACSFEQIATTVVCPVVSIHPERSTLVIYGGAVHLSKDSFVQNGITKYGLVALPAKKGWSRPIENAYLASVSQEHGVVHMPQDILQNIHPGDWVCIIPAHICLVVPLLQNYLSLDGEVFPSLCK